MHTYYLYKITNKINGKLYIGITKNPKARENRHFRYKNNNSIIALAIKKYGAENFSFEIICIGTKEYILDLEKKAIALYKTTEKEFGYNIKPGGESGRGYSIEYSQGEPVFVSGFWFPNRKTALRSLNMTIVTFKNRQKLGTLGNIVKGQVVKACYVEDFWFPSVKIACEILNMSEQTVRSRILRGFTGTKKRAKSRKGLPNNMTGIAQKDHPSSISVEISGVIYDSIKEATEMTGYSKYIINRRIKENHPDFSYRGR